MLWGTEASEPEGCPAQPEAYAFNEVVGLLSSLTLLVGVLLLA